MRAWFAVALMLLAGCSSEAPEAQDDGPDVVTSDDLGAISGVVVDATITPVVGAQVALSGQARNATTDANGQFVIDALEPGVYFLEATAPGFLPAQTSAEVSAGEVAKPRLLLAFDETPQPYQTTLQHTGFIQAWAGIASFVITVLAPELGACDCSLEFAPDDDAATYILEVFYEENTPSPAGHAGYYWELDQQEPELIQESGYGHDPVYARVAASAFGEQDQMAARFTGPDEWIALEQGFEMFVTVFYREAAPQDWSVQG